MNDYSWLDGLIDPNSKPKYVDQGSEDWHNIRAGRFTSSEIHKIMECGKRPMTKKELAARPKSGKGSATTQVPDPSKMSPAGMTYIYQKVAEVMTGQPKASAYAYPLVYGKEQEPYAVEHFEKLMGVECEEIGFQTWGDHSGGSPDRVFGKFGLEIKCPYQSENMIDYLMLTDYFDLKRMFPEYYWQCVSLLMFAGQEGWYFAAFDPRMQQDKHKMIILSILKTDPGIEDDMNAINEALKGAVKEKLAILKLLKYEY